MPRYDKPIVQASMQAARRQIESRGQAVPPEPELRHYVRLAIRHVRRFRSGLSIRSLVTTETGAFFLAWWVLDRAEKARKRLAKQRRSGNNAARKLWPAWSGR